MARSGVLSPMGTHGHFFPVPIRDPFWKRTQQASERPWTVSAQSVLQDSGREFTGKAHGGARGGSSFVNG